MLERTGALVESATTLKPPCACGHQHCDVHISAVHAHINIVHLTHTSESLVEGKIVGETLWLFCLTRRKYCKVSSPTIVHIHQNKRFWSSVAERSMQAIEVGTINFTARLKYTPDEAYLLYVNGICTGIYLDCFRTVRYWVSRGG